MNSLDKSLLLVRTDCGSVLRIVLPNKQFFYCYLMYAHGWLGLYYLRRYYVNRSLRWNFWGDLLLYIIHFYEMLYCLTASAALHDWRRFFIRRVLTFCCTINTCANGFVKYYCMKLSITFFVCLLSGLKNLRELRVVLNWRDCVIQTENKITLLPHIIDLSDFLKAPHTRHNNEKLWDDL